MRPPLGDRSWEVVWPVTGVARLVRNQGHIGSFTRVSKSKHQNEELRMKKLGQFAFAATLLVVGSLPAVAQQAQTTPSGGSMQGMSDKNMNPFQKDAMSAMDKMNKSMMQGMMDADPEMAWMKGMAAHHQGAIDMSEALLKNTKDGETAKEARKTIQQNEKDLKELQAKMKKEDKKEDKKG